MELQDLVKPMYVDEDGKRIYFIILPSETINGIAKSILILNNIRSRNFLTKFEQVALSRLMDLLGSLPIIKEEE